MKQQPVTLPYFTDDELILVKEVLDSGWVAQGPKAAIFENEIATHEGAQFALAVTSCTTALHLAMHAQGMGANMDVLVPSFTFVATLNTVVQNGATPIILDVTLDTYNIDPAKVRDRIKNNYKLEDGKLINIKTGNVLWGIVAVHQFGLCCDIYAINDIAREYNLKVLEDAACALGANIDGVHQGSFGNTSCISFHPRKSITTGEGGMVLTNDEELIKKMRELRSHGASVSADARDAGKGYLLPEFNVAGFNYRMTDICAAVGIAQAKKLDFILSSRRELADKYTKLIGEHLGGVLIPPAVPKGYYHTYQSYVCVLNTEKLGKLSSEKIGEIRNNILEKLEGENIQTRQGTHAVHTLGYYKNRFSYKGEDIPNAYFLHNATITLPLYIGMQDSDMLIIINAFKKYLKEAGLC